MKIYEISMEEYISSIESLGQEFTKDEFQHPSRFFNPVFFSLYDESELVGFRAVSRRIDFDIAIQLYIKQEFRFNTKSIIRESINFHSQYGRRRFRSRALNRLLRYYADMKDISYEIIEQNERNTLIEIKIKEPN